MNKLIVVIYSKGIGERLLSICVDIFSSLLKRFRRRDEFLFVSADIFLFGREKFSEIIGGRKIDAIIYDCDFGDSVSENNNLMSHFGVKAHVYYINSKRIVAPACKINFQKGYDSFSDELVLNTENARAAVELALDLAKSGRHEITLCTENKGMATEAALIEEYEFAAGSARRLHHFKGSVMNVLCGSEPLDEVVITTPQWEKLLSAHMARQEGAHCAALCCMGEHCNLYARAQIYGGSSHNEHIRGLLMAMSVMAQNEFEKDSAAAYLRYAVGMADKLVMEEDEENFALTVSKIVRNRRRTGDCFENTAQ